MRCGELRGWTGHGALGTVVSPHSSPGGQTFHWPYLQLPLMTPVFHHGSEKSLICKLQVPELTKDFQRKLSLVSLMIVMLYKDFSVDSKPVYEQR